MATKSLFRLESPDRGEAFKVEDIDGTASIYVDGTKVTASPAELNILDNIAADVTVSYAASATTDGIEATFTVVDAAAATIAAVHFLEITITDVTTGIGVTGTAASGALTIVTGTQMEEVVAKKHLRCQTAATGILTVKLVDSANTAGEHFCVKNPVSGKVIVGAATVAGDYEGG